MPWLPVLSSRRQGGAAIYRCPKCRSEDGFERNANLKLMACKACRRQMAELDFFVDPPPAKPV